jgi:hypothetical protein
MQLAHTWLNFFMRPILALYAAVWERLVRLNILWYFDILGKITMKRGRFTMIVPSAGQQQTGYICLMPIMSANNVLCKSAEWKLPYHSLYRFWNLDLE